MHRMAGTWACVEEAAGALSSGGSRGPESIATIATREDYREVLFLRDKEQRDLNIRLSQGRKLPTS